MFLSAESSITDITLEWFYVSMRHDVKFQLIKSVELLTATRMFSKWAFVLLLVTVSQRVTLQFIVSIKLCAAIFALKGQLSCVDHHV